MVGITISKEQQKLARARCEGLPVSIELMDYRDLTEQYDKIVSVGMFEHVGPKNYAVYFDTAYRALKDDGLFLLHTIGNSVTSPKTDAWIDKYIFPNGKLPSAKEIQFVNTADIIRCESSNTYTHFFLANGSSILVSRPIFEYDELLAVYGFVRCHQSHLVNTHFIKSWIKEDSGYLLLTDSTKIPVSRNKKDTVLKALSIKK